jgi:cephalosporin hydroxylase
VSLPLHATIGELWMARVNQHFEDSYAGVPMLQFPEDLRALEHLLWLASPNVVIEIGTNSGGSALWFRDRLRMRQQYGASEPIQVVSIDIDVSTAAAALAAADPRYKETINLVPGDVLDPDLPARVDELLPPDRRCLVVEDSAHTYETTRAALDGFARFVPAGGFFVVQDGCVDIESMRARDDWPRGVLPAIGDWLSAPGGAEFVVRRDLELYGISCHPGGFLQRKTP